MGHINFITGSSPPLGYRPIFLPHLDCFGGSDISNDAIFPPFSISFVLGVLGTSSILVKPLVDPRLFCTSFGKVVRLGVKATATFRADFLSFARTSHDLFFAKYQSTDMATKNMVSSHTMVLLEWLNLLPRIQMTDATTMIAIIAPLDRVIDPLSCPAAPAALSPAPALDPASPAEGPEQTINSLLGNTGFFN